MKERSLSLFFRREKSRYQLIKTVYEVSSCEVITCTRGQTIRKGYFPWRKGVQGLTLLLLRHKLLGSEHREAAVLEGYTKSLAASLGYAISKEAAWSNNIFGIDNQGIPRIRKILSFSNLEPRHGSPILFRVNYNILRHSNIHVFLSGDEVTDDDILRSIAHSIECLEDKNRKAGKLLSSSSIELLLEENVTTLDFSNEWLRIVGQVAVDTRQHLRATCFDNALNAWWETLAGKVYLQQNRRAIQNGTKISRVFVADPENLELLKGVLKHAKVHRDIGVDARIIFREHFNPLLGGEFLSIHDDKLSVAHTHEGNSELIINNGTIQDATEYFDDIFGSKSVSIEKVMNMMHLDFKSI